MRQSLTDISLHEGPQNHQVAAGTLESVPEWECRSEKGERGLRLLPRASRAATVGGASGGGAQHMKSCRRLQASEGRADKSQPAEGTLPRGCCRGVWVEAGLF